MSEFIHLSSTDIVVKPENLSAFFSATAAVFEDYYSEDMLEQESTGDGLHHFTLFYQEDVGDSFVERVGAFSASVSKLTEAPFEIQARGETMADERDQFFYGGPEGSVEVFADRCRIERADEILRDMDFSVYPNPITVAPGDQLEDVRRKARALLTINSGNSEPAESAATVAKNAEDLLRTFLAHTGGEFESTMTFADRPKDRTSFDGHAVIEDALKKASRGNLADAPFPLTGEAAKGYMQGLAAAYLHALEMIPATKSNSQSPSLSI